MEYPCEATSSVRGSAPPTVRAAACLVHNSRRLALRLRQDDIDEVLGRRHDLDLLEVIDYHYDGTLVCAKLGMPVP